MIHSQAIDQFSEEQLIERISKYLPSTDDIVLGPGDDCAIVRAHDSNFVVSTDVLVEDRHFRRDWITGYQLGQRALAQNMADIAAMGARPTAIVVALTIPGDLSISWLEELAAGMGSASARAGAAVAGGDLVRGAQISLAVTVMGSMDGAAPVLRSGARAGHIIAHAGRAGWAAAGFALLERGETAGPLVAAHLVPEPPLRAGVAAAKAGASAMLDVSDGILRDAGRIARASNVVLDIEQAAISRWEEPLRQAGEEVGEDPRTWVLAGGEDHGLLATFPAAARLPDQFTPIGEVRAAAGEPGVVISGRPVQIRPGWDHFS